ncbi:GntR family transcriptional regulator [Marinilactibacillus psychrotolerans]|uniref:GntR family transcriptional regulator n=1 Tax=Marinilactibacillus psychrotolerans TaxID=191770 RepID=UPI00388AEBA9
MESYIDEVIEIMDLSQNKPLNEIVFEGFRQAIIKGIIPVGERINEKECAVQLNISRTPIREALRRIEKEGLVEYVPKFGVVVKKISVEDAEEIYQIRKSLDILATINAMKIMSTQEFSQMENLLEETKRANEAEEVDKVIQYFSDFNMMIYQYSRMPRLESIVRKLREYLTRFRDISLSGENRRRKALNEHCQIFKMMKNQEYDKISDVIEEHLDYSKSFVIQEMVRVQEGGKESHGRS